MQEIIIEDILHQPSTKVEKVNMFGFEFFGIQNSPNVYVVKSTSEIIEDDITFTFKNINYELKNIKLHSSNNDMLILECRRWRERVI